MAIWAILGSLCYSDIANLFSGTAMKDQILAAIDALREALDAVDAAEQAEPLPQAVKDQLGTAEGMYAQFVGRYVICRSRNDGLNAGVVLAADETGVWLYEARRLWYHKPAKEGSCWYEAIAQYGLSEESKISEPVSKLIVEDYSLTICTRTAEASIRGMKAHGN